MNTVKVIAVGGLVIAYVPGRDQAVCIDTDQAMDLWLALAHALPELQAALKDFAARMTS